MSKELQKEPSSQESNKNSKSTRDWLTYILAAGSLIGILAISVVHIAASSNEDRNAASERVFNTTMPLFGTWMGSLIAFYFAKENLDAAAESSRKLTNASISLMSTGTDKLETIRVSAVINSRFLREYIGTAFAGEANQPNIVAGESNLEEKQGNDVIQERKLEDILKRMEQYSRKRLPIFGLEKLSSDLTGDKLKLLVYYDDIVKYGKDNGGETLSDFVASPSVVSKTFIFVGPAISLAEADRERLKKPGCRDIFVTDNGLSSGKVVGYLTDSDIDQYRAST